MKLGNLFSDITEELIIALINEALSSHRSVNLCSCERHISLKGEHCSASSSEVWGAYKR